MSKREKKFFVKTLQTNNNNINSRWYIYWYIPLKGTDIPFRIKISGGINRHKTLETRLLAANAMLKEIDVYTYHLHNINKPNILDNTILHQAIRNKNLRENGIKHYIARVNSFLKWFKRLPQECTQNDAKAFIQHLHDEKKNNTTINHSKAALKTLFDWAIANNYLETNPFNGIKKLKEDKQSKMFFNDLQLQEITTYLKAFNPAMLFHVGFIYYCFIRPEELRKLQVKHIDFYRNKITIPGSISKNGKTQTIEIPKPFQCEFLQLSKKPKEHFILGNGITMMGKNNLAKNFRKVLNQLGYGNEYSLYSFKHTGAVKFAKHSKDLKALQMQLRHHSLDMVNEYLKNMGAMDNEEVIYNFPAM